MNSKNIIRICQALIVSYLVSALLILFYALIIWKFEISEQLIKGAVIILYILSAAVGGIYIGKKQGEKKFLWGLLTGCLYFMLFFMITALSEGFSGHFGMHFFTTLFLCSMSGTLGGMLA